MNDAGGPSTGFRAPALTCWPVIVEAAHLLRRSEDGRSSLFSFISNADLVSILSIGQNEVQTIVRWMSKYHDRQVDFADAVLVHLADRESVRAVATLDEDFRVYRTRGGKALKVMPD